MLLSMADGVVGCLKTDIVLFEETANPAASRPRGSESLTSDLIARSKWDLSSID